MTTILCFYHAPCNDGSAAAAALHHRLTQRGMLEHTDIRFCPVTYNTEWNAPFSPNYLHREIVPKHPVEAIYLLDVSFSNVKYDQVMEHLRETNKLAVANPPTICIDHHETARQQRDELLQFCDEAVIEMGPGLSGATLVWNYFNNQWGAADETPMLLRYIADQDIWEWALPESAEINAALNTMDGYVDSMQHLLNEFLADPERVLARLLSEGRGIVKMVEAQIAKVMHHTIDLHVDGVTVRVVNSSAFSSELGNFLCNHSHDKPNVIGLIYSIQEDLAIRCSVRSIEGGKVNARGFAERFGGGGHNHASGCRFHNYQDFWAALNQLVKDGWG